MSLSFLILLMGCGRSPLLHHDNEISPSQAAARVIEQVSQMDSTCYLQFEKAGQVICARIQWVKGPTIGENAFDIRFSTPIDIGELRVDPTMPEHGGHGTSPVDLATEDSYLVHVRDIWLTMGGTWLVTIRLGTSVTSFEVKL